MPHFWNNTRQVAVEVAELVPAFWSSQKVLSMECSRNKDRSYGVKALQNGGGKGRRLLIDFDSLPGDIQDALGDIRKVEHNLLYFYKTEAIAVDFYTKFRLPDGGFLSGESQERYITNASVMIALVQLKIKQETEMIRMGKNLKGLFKFLTEESNSFNTILEKRNLPLHNLPGSEKRFKEGFEAFSMPFQYNDKEWPYNFMSLVKDVAGNSKKNGRLVDDVTLGLLNGMFSSISHKPSKEEIYRNYEAFLSGYLQVYNEDTGEIYEPKDFPKLSKSTIARYLNQWENKAATYKSRSGDRQKYMGAFKIHHQLERPKFAGSIISVDDRQPPFKDLSGNRVWFYNALDVASGCITVSVYGKSKEGIIKEFYREMVRNYTAWGINLPHELEAESSLNSSFKDTFLKEGYMFQKVRIEANNARGKRIERDNGILRYGIEKQRVGWIARHSAKSENNQVGSEKVPEIPYEQIIENGLEDICTLNNMPHSEDPTLTRWEYFMEHQHPELKPTNWEAILPYLGYKQDTSCQVGYIKLQGKKRAIAQNGKICTGEELISVMKQIEGKDIEVYWLDAKNGSVLKALAFYDGKMICEVMEMPRYNRAILERTDADEAARTLQSAYVNTVDAFVKSQQQKIQSIGIIKTENKPIVNGFVFPGMEKKIFTTSTEQPQTITLPKEEEILQTETNVAWRNSFFK